MVDFRSRTGVEGVWFEASTHDEPKRPDNGVERIRISREHSTPSPRLGDRAQMLNRLVELADQAGAQDSINDTSEITQILQLDSCSLSCRMEIGRPRMAGLTWFKPSFVVRRMSESSSSSISCSRSAAFETSDTAARRARVASED